MQDKPDKGTTMKLDTVSDFVTKINEGVNALRDSYTELDTVLGPITAPATEMDTKPGESVPDNVPLIGHLRGIQSSIRDIIEDMRQLTDRVRL